MKTGIGERMHPHRSTGPCVWRCLVLGLLLGCGQAVAQSGSPAEVLIRAEADLAGGAFAQAYESLSPLEFDQAGDPSFDYALGVAAQRSGRPGEALMALERVLLADPMHAGARMELMYVYLALGDIEAAERQIAWLEAHTPPERAAEAIAQARAWIEDRQRNERLSLTGSISLAAGYDSNARRGPDALDPALDNLFGALFGDAFFDAVGERDSTFGVVSGYHLGRRTLANEDRLTWMLQGQTRRYNDETVSAYDLGIAAGELGWERPLDAERDIGLAVEAARIWSDRPLTRLLDQTGGSATYRQPVGAGSRGHARLRLRDSDYRATPQQNYRTAMLELGVETPLTSGLRTTAQLLVEREYAQDDGPVGQERRAGGDLTGARLDLGVDIPLNATAAARFTGFLSQRRYQEAGFPALTSDLTARERQDIGLGASASLQVRLGLHWLMEFNLEAERRNSNINFFDYNRASARGGVSYVF